MTSVQLDADLTLRRGAHAVRVRSVGRTLRVEPLGWAAWFATAATAWRHRRALAPLRRTLADHDLSVVLGWPRRS